MPLVAVYEAIYVVFHSNFATYIVCCAISRVSFLDLFGPIAGVTNPITWHIYGKFWNNRQKYGLHGILSQQNSQGAPKRGFVLYSHIFLFMIALTPLG